MSNETYEMIQASLAAHDLAPGNLEKKATKSDLKLDSALTLKRPVKIQNSIEFNQVFKVNPSDTFLALYNQCHNLDSPNSNNAQIDTDNYTRNNIRLIDTRPLRWYKMLASLEDKVNDLRFNLQQYLKEITELQSEISKFPTKDAVGPKRDECEALKESLSTILGHKKRVGSLVFDCQQTIKQVIYDISTAGYIYAKENNVTKIYKPIAKTTVQPPLNQGDLQVDSDDKWNSSLTKLTNALFITGGALLTSVNKVNAFRQNSADLASVTSCSSIQSDLNTINETINNLQETITTLQNTLAHDSDNIMKNAQNTWNQLINNCQQAIDGRNALLNQVKQALTDLYNRLKLAPPADGSVDYVKGINFILNTNFMSQVKAYDPSPTPNPYSDLLTQINNYSQNLTQYTAARDTAIKDYTNLMNQNISDCKAQLAAEQTKLKEYPAAYNLLLKRGNFLLYWNNPQNYDALTINKVYIDPNDDPMQQFYNDYYQTAANMSKPYQIHRFAYEGDGYYNEDQLSLVDFMKLPDVANQIVLLPYLDSNGQTLNELMRVITAPRTPSGAAAPKVPVVKIVETHVMNLTWKSFALSELSDAINLAPGEKKQIVVQKQTKITQQINKSSSTDSEQCRNVTSSFEDNLTNELSSAYNVSHSDQNTTAYKNDQNTTNRSASSHDDSSGHSSSAKASASGGFLGIKASGDASYSANSIKKSTQQQSIEAALAVSQSQNAQTLAQTSRNISLKNLSNKVNKVASETSSNNKISVTTSSSDQYEESTSNKEIVKLNNPNEGLAINYNLFQVQNVYKSMLTLKDAKIVVNTGIELVEGSGIYNVRVYELEQFNKIFKNTGKSNVETLLCARIARKILKNYTDILSNQPLNKGVIQIKIGPNDNFGLRIGTLQSIAAKLDLCDVIQNGDSRSLQNTITMLKNTLCDLQKFTFVFKENHVLDVSEHVINAPAYHMDTQLGRKLAVETYLEDRRETTLQREKSWTGLIHAGSSLLSSLSNMWPRTNAAPNVTALKPLVSNSPPQDDQANNDSAFSLLSKS